MNKDPQDVPEKKKQSIDVAQIVVYVKPVGVFIKRHLVLMFIALTLSALIYAVFMVNTILLQQNTASSDTTSSKYNTGFDQDTIGKINALNNHDQTPTINLPPGRINPFSE